MCRFFRHASILFTWFLLVPRPCFPARNVPDSVTVLTAGPNDSSGGRGPNATWQDYMKFLDAGKGSHVDGMSELKRYFSRFGYLSGVPASSNFTDVFDNDLESAIVAYQMKMSLPVTGKLDSETISAVMTPRCGVSDDDAGGAMGTTTRRFTYFEGVPRWNRGEPLTLRYALSPEHTYRYLSSGKVRQVFRRAFSRWSEAIPVSFIESSDYKTADIRIGFYAGDHGDGRPFDGVLGVLAHAFAPEDGRSHFDAAETWAVDFTVQKSKTAVDLESVAIHEIGHVLGLGHSSVKKAVMYARLSPRTRKVDLTMDDVEGVQALYGSNPNFKISTLWESESYANRASCCGLLGTRRWYERSTCLVMGVVLVMALC